MASFNTKSTINALDVASGNAVAECVYFCLDLVLFTESVCRGKTITFTLRVL